MLTLNTNQARAADNKGEVITAAGKYVGVITRAEKLMSRENTEGLGLSFRADDGATANYLDVWLKKSNGDELFGLKTANALMACLQLRQVDEGEIECEKWNKDARAMEKVRVPGYPAMMGKRIGLLLQEVAELDQNNKVRNKVQIYAVFQAETDLTASEVLDRKTTPEKLQKLVAALMANPLRDNTGGKKTAAQPSTGFDDVPDDLPW